VIRETSSDFPFQAQKLALAGRPLPSWRETGGIAALGTHVWPVGEPHAPCAADSLAAATGFQIQGNNSATPSKAQARQARQRSARKMDCHPRRKWRRSSGRNRNCLDLPISYFCHPNLPKPPTSLHLNGLQKLNPQQLGRNPPISARSTVQSTSKGARHLGSPLYTSEQWKIVRLQPNV
jgi:hypothetical protein